jgi:hypothetical protein
MISIFQRHCNFSTQSANKPRPDWFDREKIFDHFMLTLFDDKYKGRVEYTAFHDSGNGDVDDHFLSRKDVNIISKHGGNDAQSFLNLLNYVKEQNFDSNDIIYFVEDDYLHQYGWVDILQEGFDMIGADYYTLYDHPDKYYLPMYQDLQSKVIATKNIHWRTTPSTTNTYACKYSTLMKHFDIHVKYCDLVEKWTKDHVKFTELWQRGSNLMSCVPGYSTHVEGNMLSPIIDWEKV